MSEGKRTRNFAFVSLSYGRSGEEICTGYAMAASGRMQYDYKQTNSGSGSNSDNGSNSNPRQFHGAERPFGEIISKEKSTWNLTGLDAPSDLSMVSDRILGSCRSALCDALQGHNPESWNLFRNTP